MSSRLFFFSLAFFLCTLSANAQDDAFIKDILEGAAENLAEDVDLYELTERLNYLLSHPINVNEASAENLKQLLFLSPLQISNLLKHIQTNGKLLDLAELQSIEGFDLVTVGRLRPFLSLSQKTSISNFSLAKLGSAGIHDLMLRYGRVIEVPKGFTDLPGSRYLGSQDKALLRYKYSYANRIAFGLVMEKDAGEHSFKEKCCLTISQQISVLIN